MLTTEKASHDFVCSSMKRVAAKFVSKLQNFKQKKHRISIGAIKSESKNEERLYLKAHFRSALMSGSWAVKIDIDELIKSKKINY